ncbi:5'/3'-nucleotidase SurE [[Clostridium] hylemonae]
MADILIAAPHTQQTGMGRAFPRTEDTGVIESELIDIHGRLVRAYGVHGSPALAAAHGILELAGRRPDLCVSGINYGENMGAVLTCSGTLGAAFEAVSHNVPAIAVSLEADLKIQRSNEFKEADFGPAAEVLRTWTARVLEEGMPENVDILNINVPANPRSPGEYRITAQSRQNYFEFIRPGERELDRPFSMKSRLYVDEETLERESDIYAVYVDKVASVTPLNIVMSVEMIP